jgi:hypothetical protein
MWTATGNIGKGRQWQYFVVLYLWLGKKDQKHPKKCLEKAVG